PTRRSSDLAAVGPYTMKQLVLPSPAKINLFLHITGQRADGYHLLQTLFTYLDYNDTLSFTRAQNIELNAPAHLGNVADNLIYRAAVLLQQHKIGRASCREGGSRTVA